MTCCAVAGGTHVRSVLAASAPGIKIRIWMGNVDIRMYPIAAARRRESAEVVSIARVARTGECGTKESKMRRLGVRVCRAVAAATVVLLVYSTPARADAIKVTTGVLALSRQDFAGLHVGNGTTFDLRGAVGQNKDSYSPPYACGFGQECSRRPFDVSMSDTLKAGPVNEAEPDIWGSFTFDGLSYGLDTFDFTIVGDHILVPNDGFVSTPFHFVGTVGGTTRDGTSQTLQLQGRGTASSYWTLHDGWLSTEYKFQDLAQTPEPASMLLIATGLSGLAAGRKRARIKK